MRIGPAGRSLSVVLVLVVPTALTFRALVDAYQRGYDTERALRAGAEPVLAGIFVASPWIALLAAELVAVILVGLWRATRQPAATARDAAREN